MTTPDRLPPEALDRLLDGSPSEEAVESALGAYLAALREDAAATTPVPSADLAEVLAEGLDPADLGAAGTVATDAVPAALPWWRRSRLAVRALATKFAALGLVAKAATAGAAVTVAASGAGAAGVLPEPAQETFDEIVGREVQEAPAEPAEDADTDTGDEAGTQDDHGVDAPPAGGPPADTATTPPLEQDVSDDATGSSDGEPGVDGGDVADDASDGRSTDARGGAEDGTTARDRRSGNAPDSAPAGREEGPEAGDSASDRRPATPGEIADDHRRGGRTTPDGDQEGTTADGDQGEVDDEFDDEDQSTIRGGYWPAG